MLVLSGIIFFAGGLLYTGRAILKWPFAAAPAFLCWERGFVIAALLAAVSGLTMLERMLEAAGDRVLAPAALVMLLIGTALVINAETLLISGRGLAYAPVVAFVVLAFLAQAALGAALIRTELLPGWVGWAALLWNLVWLVVLPIARPRDMYYPWLHYATPVLIGIELLVTR